jgi:hypothetical protein
VHIGWVGGLDRSRALFSRVAAQAGHTLELHTGHVQGRGGSELAGIVSRCDLLVIVTELNSHGGMLSAKEFARRKGRPAILVRKSSIATLERVLRELAVAS